MNREQRRRAKRSGACILCQLADGTMDAQAFAAHCCEVAHTERGMAALDEFVVNCRHIRARLRKRWWSSACASRAKCAWRTSCHRRSINTHCGPGDDDLKTDLSAELQAINELRAELREGFARLQEQLSERALVGAFNDAELLRAIAAATGGGAATFSAAELCDMAHAADGAELRAAIDAAVGSLNPKRLGIALADLEGTDCGGWTIRRLHRERGGFVWAIAAS
jgi:hypothetical protein